MAMTTTPLGFKKPDGNELIRGGDNVIADNAQVAQDLIADLNTRLAIAANPFNIGLDTDGTPYFSEGAAGLSLEADTDGVPYFI